MPRVGAESEKKMKVMVNKQVVGELVWLRVEQGAVTIQLANCSSVDTDEQFTSCTFENVQTVEVLINNLPRRAFVEEEYFE